MKMLQLSAPFARWGLALPLLALRLAAADDTAIRLPPWYGDCGASKLSE